MFDGLAQSWMFADPVNWKTIPVDIKTNAIMKKAICHSSFVPLITIEPIIYGATTEATCPTKREKEATPDV